MKQKYLFLLMSLLFLLSGVQTSQATITTGYYRVVSYNGKYLTENTSSHSLICSDLMTNNYSQVWYLSVDGTNVTFKNALTDRYVKGQLNVSYQYETETSITAFTWEENDNVYTFKYDPYSWYSGGLHCDQYLKVVQYDIAEAKSKWTLESATVDEAALTTQKNATSEASTADLLKVFTSTDCTELKSGYSESDLAALPTTVQALATKINNNSWATYAGWTKTEKSFRIADYKAYSSHTRWANILNFDYSFGRLTNPTGIYVDAGDYIQVYVGTIPSGETVKLEVAGAGQGSGFVYTLHEGMNSLLMAASGNCFVNYEVDNTTNGGTPYKAISTYADVTVHIEGGTVQGYLDLTKGDTNFDWAAMKAYLLSKPAVCLKSKTHVFNIHRDRLVTTIGSDGKVVEMMTAWQQVAELEDRLIGREDFDDYCNNTFSVTTMDGSGNPHATSYGTYYHEGGDGVLNVDQLMQYMGGLWTIAHEQGHNRQKLIKMAGTTEISNNMFSNAVLDWQGRFTSRVNNIQNSYSRWQQGMSWPERLADNGTWECLHLYTQLYQYFHQAGFNTNFYPNLFRALRTDPMVIHGGDQFTLATEDYLKFYKKCCDVAELDLTEFFEVYGFFTLPPAQESKTLGDITTTSYYTVPDYTTSYMYVTQEMINEVKAYVAAKKYPKCNLIFIEDRVTAPLATYEGHTDGEKRQLGQQDNVTAFGQVGETGQYTTFGDECSAYTYQVGDDYVTMTGTGAVGFKVYDSTGKLRGVYNTNTFTLPDGIGTGYTIKAAAGNGTDVEAAYDSTLGVVESDVTVAPDATASVTAGSQITAESQLVSGKLYLVYYVGNGASGYMKDTGSAYNGYSDNNATQNAVYRFTSNGDGTWTVQNFVTGKYWGTPTADANAYVGSDDAGSWTLNFQSGGNIAPSCNGHSWNRSGSNVHPWSVGVANVNQLKIEAVTYNIEDVEDFSDKDVSVSSDAAATLQTGQWYVMFDRGANHGYLYENGENTLYNTATAPSGSATDNAKYLVRIVGWENEYYLQTGLGHFFGNIQQGTAVPTTETATESITLKKIADTDGHYYLMSSAGVVLDANDLSLGDGTVVGWGTTAPTATGGNNDWAFYPVEFVDSWIPTVEEVYTLNNTNSGRGAMMYNGSSDYVWSSGKSGTFDAAEANCQWVLVPTDTDKQYYLYNVGAQKFAIPSATTSTASWVFSNDAVAVTLIHQSDGTYKIKTATTDTYAAVSNGYNGPIINYNDVGGNFTITLVEDQNQSEAATAALNKLMKNQTALTAVPDDEGWYAIKIKNGNYADEFVYAPEDEIAYQSGRNYPLTFMNNINKQPAINNTAYLTHITKTDDGYAWQLPNGQYLYSNSSNYFPTSTTTVVENVQLTYDSGFKFSNANSSKTLYAVAYYLGSKYFLGESDKVANATLFDVYPVDLADASLAAWKVTITNGTSDLQLSCTRSDVSGRSTVYSGGYFFLPADVTPVSGDFALEGMISCTVNAEDRTISAEYDPELSLLITDLAVIQGHQVTGKGNTAQALLRMKTTPFSDFQPTQLGITLSGAAQVDNVKVYATTSDQIRFEGVTPTLLATNATPADGAMTITLTDAPSVAAGSTVYYWITADVKSSATEWETIDAALTSVSYTNSYKAANSLDDTTLDLTSIGNPNGEMRIYNSQTTLWTSSQTGSRYYRIPALLKTGENTLLAFTDDRYNRTTDLGSHKIDVLVKKSTDGGRTWGDAVTVAAGDGSSNAAYGYGDAAVAKAANGDIVCLMAAGKNSYSGGMLHIGLTKSTDGGDTWSTPVDIYGNTDYLTNPHATGTTTPFTSTFVSSGHGITQTIAHPGRIAFPALGKISSGTNEYVIYSDDNGDTWTFTDNAGFTGADESKLEEMNDGNLLMSIRCGGFNSSNVARGYNRTTDTDVENWGTQGTWSDLTANGCNSDLLYYSRAINDEKDVLLHSVVKSYSNHRKDLRLYMSFDQGQTWKEAFSLQPGWAAYSSMQVLDNGDLAILFEDGSIGNEDLHDCYDINYVTISSELINAKIDELYDAMLYAEVKNSVLGSSTGCDTYGALSNASSGWNTTWTSNASAGVAGVTVVASGNDFAPSTVYNQRCLAMRPSAAGATDVITITAPAGYLIKSYTITGRNYSGSQTYQLYVDENVKTTTSTGGATFAVDDVNAQSTSFKFYGSSISNYLCVTNFVITLTNELVLSNSEDNTAVIEAASGQSRTVKLANRTLYKDGAWNTLCLPFALDASALKNSPLATATIMELDTEAGSYDHITGFEDGTLYLNFKNATSVDAGIPYLVKWQSGQDLVNPTFLGVTIGSETPTGVNSDDEKVTFCGTYAPVNIIGEDKTKLFMSTANTLYYPNGSMTIGSQRGYFQLNNGITVGDPGNGVRAFVLNFGESETTGIMDMRTDSSLSTPSQWYDLSGRRFNGKPAQKGVYINNGKKVIIK